MATVDEVKKLLLVVALVGCAGEPTLGDVCPQAAEAFCAKAEACNATTTHETCVQTFVGHCCAYRGTCDRRPADVDLAAESCAQAYDSVTCAELGYMQPSGCNQLKQITLR